MTYTPINWQTGDTITAEKLNKMDNGWEEQETQLFNETVTTVALPMGNTATLAYSSAITAPVLNVTFDGTDYTCEAFSIGSDRLSYGGLDTYPFQIISANGMNTLYTETAGSYTISVSAIDFEVSQEFDNVVNSCVDTSTMPMLCISGTTTMNEMFAASANNRVMYFTHSDFGFYFVTLVTMTEVHFIPTDSRITANFDSSDVFTVTAS